MFSSIFIKHLLVNYSLLSNYNNIKNKIHLYKNIYHIYKAFKLIIRSNINNVEFFHILTFCIKFTSYVKY